MALEVYFQEDIAAAIVSTTVGMLRASAAHGFTNVQYVRGIIDMAHAQALNYRIPWSAIKKQLLEGVRECGVEIPDLMRFSTEIEQSEEPKIGSLEQRF